MSKPYDSTVKHLLDNYAADWLPLVPGLPAGATGEPLDADLATVQLAADRVFRLRPPAEGIVHLEPQSSWDGDLPDRLLEYNVLLHRRHGGPVYTAAVLLRRDANSPLLTGVVSRRTAGGREYLRFEYAVIRVWTLPAEPLLTGGIGLTPLALVTDEAAPRLGEYVDRIDARCRAEGVPDAERDELLFCGKLLCGLRYTTVEIAAAFARVKGMKESIVYQETLQEGVRVGQMEGKKADILAILADRFGIVPPEVETRVRAETDLQRLSAALLRATRVTDPNDLEL